MKGIFYCIEKNCKNKTHAEEYRCKKHGLRVISQKAIERYKNPKNNPMFGKKHTKEANLRNRLAKLGKTLKENGHKNNCMCSHCKMKRGESLGKNAPNYKHGLSYYPYPTIFTRKLKDFIRKRDNFTCQCCGITEEEHLLIINQVLTIHHINYNKFNCEDWNLITICRKCNAKSNGNRDFWYVYYIYILTERGIIK